MKKLKEGDVVAVDYDGTLTTMSIAGYKWTEDLTPAHRMRVKLLRHLEMYRELGGKVALWTSREGHPLSLAVESVRRVSTLKFDYINRIPGQKEWCYEHMGEHYNGKMFAALLIDDMADNIGIGMDALKRYNIAKLVSIKAEEATEEMQAYLREYL